MKKLIYFIAIAIMLFACKSKKKIIERSVVNTKTEAVVKVDEEEQKDIKTDSVVVDKSETVKVMENESLELTQADPEKEITVTQSNGKTLKVKGANVKIINTKTKEITKDSLNVKLSKSDKSKQSIKKDSIGNSESKKINRTSESDAKTTSTWFWILLILAAVVLAYFKRDKILGVLKKIVSN